MLLTPLFVSNINTHCMLKKAVEVYVTDTNADLY